MVKNLFKVAHRPHDRLIMNSFADKFVLFVDRETIYKKFGEKLYPEELAVFKKVRPFLEKLKRIKGDAFSVPLPREERLENDEIQSERGRSELRVERPEEEPKTRLSGESTFLGQQTSELRPDPVLDDYADKVIRRWLKKNLQKYPGWKNTDPIKVEHIGLVLITVFTASPGRHRKK